MIVGEATTTVSATPDEVFDFVLDLHRYRQADHMIGMVGTIHNEGDRGTAQFSGRIRGLPAPSGTYPFTRTDSRLAFGSPIAGPAWFVNFEGTFDTERTHDGTVVTHREAFSFKRLWLWLAEPLLGSSLEKDTTEEMVRFKQLIERVDDEPASEQQTPSVERRVTAAHPMGQPCDDVESWLASQPHLSPGGRERVARRDRGEPVLSAFHARQVA